MTNATGQARPTHGRIVMLVDNGVDGDSRVQKSARSAADAGWDVVLLGRGKGGQRQTWQLGAAEVRIIPTTVRFAKRREDFRRPWLAAPFAYPPTGVGAYRKQAVAMWHADLRVRRAAAEQARRGGRSASLMSRQALKAESLAAKVTSRWVKFRDRQVDAGQRYRTRLSGPWQRAYTWFWRLTLGNRAWRRIEPQLWDYELTFGKTIDELAPDIIHANDFRMLGVGARAAIRARANGRTVKLVWDVHEFLPGVKPRRNDHRWLPGNLAHEHEYSPYADAVVTVSDGVADLVTREHGLTERPTIVLNAPETTVEMLPSSTPTVRDLCGIGPDVPLLVYSGVAAPQRGLDIMVESLAALGDTHVALVVASVSAPYIMELTARAAELGASDRVHVMPFVPHTQVARFLSTADVGVIPIRHFPNHEIALITKFFEYSHARLPILVSDVRTMAEKVRSTGQGEVFRAEDTDDFVRAAREILSRPKDYRAAYDTGLLEAWTWEAQARILDGVYRRVAGLSPSDTDAPMAAASYQP